MTDLASHDATLFPGWEKMQDVDGMAIEAFDALPFGAIKLSPDGTIERYNAMEATISGRKSEDVIGKNFFTEVAPCTNVQEFAGRFREGVETGSLNAVFPYHFDFRMKPTDVWIRLHYSTTTGAAWVFVTQRDRDA